MKTHFQGYRREDGRVGIRNHVAIVSVQAAVNSIVRRAAANAAAEPVMHDHESLEHGPDAELAFRSVVGMATHPNVGAVVLVGLSDKAVRKVADAVPDTRVTLVSVEACGGARAALQKATDAAAEHHTALANEQRVEVPVSSLVVGLKCGGSDSMSGLSCNPALGEACNILVDLGGTCVLTETSGIYGAEFVLAAQAEDETVATKIYEIVDRVEREALLLGESLARGNPSPGNIDGGLTTLAEKSLGTIKKCGSRPIRAVLAFAEPITQKGAVVMDTPGLDVYSVSGAVAGGAQIVAFTTGRGSPLGAPIAAVQKICGNPETFERLHRNMDINAGTVITGNKTLKAVGEEIFDDWVSVAEGKRTKAERLHHTEFAIPRAGTVI